MIDALAIAGAFALNLLLGGPRWLVYLLMWLALGVFTAAIALAVLGVAALVGAGP